MSNPWPNGLHIPMKGETIINKHTEKINCWKIISAMGKKIKQKIGQEFLYVKQVTI
jgi:hypothetical protein